MTGPVATEHELVHFESDFAEKPVMHHLCSCKNPSDRTRDALTCGQMRPREDHKLLLGSEVPPEDRCPKCEALSPAHTGCPSLL